MDDLAAKLSIAQHNGASDRDSGVQLLRRKLNGELDGRGAELDAARKLIGV